MAKQKTDDQNEVTKQAIINPEAWSAAEGVEYGGSSEILKLEEGQVAGEFIYVGSSSITTDLGETTGHTASTPQGVVVRLPIAASFLRCLDQAGIKRGDKFLVRREADKVKEKGVGKGQNMAIYAVKLISRAEVAE